MRSAARKVAKPSLIVLAIASLLASIPAWAASTPADATVDVARPNTPARPAAPTAAHLTAADVTIELCASQGDATMPDASSVPIWGFSVDTGAGCGAATLPGPVLQVDEGDVVTVVFENVDVPANVAVAFPGQQLRDPATNVPIPPDATGDAAGGGTVTYEFVAKAGTFLYQAGLDVTSQVPMGLYGALVVNAATGAYGAGTEFDAETVLVLSEVDPDLNTTVDGGSPFDLLGYDPTFWLINGQGFDPSGATLNPIVSAAAGEDVLLRYVNAGLEHDTMLLLGSHQRLVAKDANRLTNPYDVTSETIPAGSTMDAIVTIPASAASGSKLWLYNRGLRLDDGTAPFTPDGGMMGSIAVS